MKLHFFIFSTIFIVLSVKTTSWARVLSLLLPNDNLVGVKVNSLLENVLNLPILSSSITMLPEHLLKIDPDLLSAFRKFEKRDVLVNFGGNSVPLAVIRASQFGNRVVRHEALVNELKTWASLSQSAAKILMQSLGKPFTSFWAANAMVVRDAGITDIQVLSLLEGVKELALALTFPIQPILSPASGVQILSDPGLQWGIERIEADKVWSTFKNTGENVTVANIDTGVLGTHEALAENFRGDHAWFGTSNSQHVNGWALGLTLFIGLVSSDPYSGTLTPNDQNGHGTHTMGTICGIGGIGVAPGSKWIACRGCDSSSCGSPQLLACGDWMLHPTNADGSGGDATKIPDVINNSWGSSVGGDSWYTATIDAWKAAGILSAFAIGNSGPICGTGGSPGDQQQALSVGSTNVDDRISSFSSRGPVTLNLPTVLVKPEVSAPGENILSCWFTQNDSYNTISGTSMATPHAVGTMALVLSEFRAQIGDSRARLPFDLMSAILQTTAFGNGNIGTFSCPGGTNNQPFPNNEFGSGRINASKAVGSVANS